MRALVLLTAAALCATVGLGHGSQVKLVNHGYEGLVIAINPAVPEDPKLIDAIKKMITNASSALFTASKYKVYFRNVNILIPASWTANSIYKRPKSESYGTADVRIESHDDPTDNEPYTHQFGLCGDPGQYMHFTPNFLLTDLYLEAYGPREKVFVHEWAHLRWGVYDEYSDQQPFYFDSVTRKIEFTRCSREITGALVMVVRNGSDSTRDCDIDPNTNLPEKGCVFFPDEVQKASSSMMSIQALDNVTDFCYHNDHNRQAPTLHNRLCQKQSIWKVILQHADMQPKTRSPVDTDTQPSFTLLQPTPRVVTLVLDVSGSMSNENRMQRMRQAAEQFVMKILDSGTMVGIVTFQSAAETNLPLTKITDEASRQRIKNNLPNAANGGTNVCAGVKHGFQVLKALDGDVYGDEIVLLTDGEDNGISNCVDEVQQSQCIVHTIALGPSADPALEKLTTPGGFTFSASDNLDTNSLVDAFSSAKTDDGDKSSLVLQLDSTGKSLDDGETMKGEIKVDASIGKNTQFAITWLSSTVPEMHVFDPDNVEYTNDKFLIDEAFKTARLTIPGISKPGMWTYGIKNKHSSRDNIAMSIMSSQSDDKLPPIEVKVIKPKESNDKLDALQVFAEVKQGSSAVLGATVIAIIERPKEVPLELQLFDNGAGADAIKNDGIYSRYFAQYTATGRYSIKVKVVGENGTRLAPHKGSRSLYIPGKRKENGELEVTKAPPPVVKPEVTSVPHFSRVASGGSIQVTVPPGGRKDIFAPCAITDLTAELQNFNSVILVWTAPGDDGDYGQAAMYRIMVSSSFDGVHNGTDRSLVSSKSVTVGNLSAPAMAGTVENFTITMPRLSAGVELYWCVQAIDGSNNEAPLSNVVAIYVPDPTTTRAAATTHAAATTRAAPTTRAAATTRLPTMSLQSSSSLKLILPPPLIGTSLVILCIVVIWRLLHRNRNTGQYKFRMENVVCHESEAQGQPLKVVSSATVSKTNDSQFSSSPHSCSSPDSCRVLLDENA